MLNTFYKSLIINILLFSHLYLTELTRVSIDWTCLHTHPERQWNINCY